MKNSLLTLSKVALLSFFLWACTNSQQDLNALFSKARNDIENNNSFHYNGEVFSVLETSTNHARITFKWDKWTDITYHNGTFTFSIATSNTLDDKEIKKFTNHYLKHK
jgi:outer membrane biogenesis lipoprotein LolB